MIFPFRILIPALSLVVGLALVSWQAWQIDVNLEDREMTNALKNLRGDMTSLQGELDLHLKSGDMHALQGTISRLGFQPRNRESAVIDDSGIIIAAGRLEDVGKDVTILGDTANKDILARVRQRMAGEVLADSEGNILTAYYPVILGNRAGELRSSRTGILFTRYSISEDRAEIRDLIVGSSLRGVIFVLVLMGLVWLGLHFALNRRVARLVASTQRYAEGDFSASAALGGHDELTELSQACDEMAEKIAEAQISATSSSQLLAEAQKIAHIGSWRWDIIGGSLTWSDEIFRIFGLQPQEFGATYDAFLESVYPDDRDLVQSSVTESIENHTPYRIEHRVIWRDGTVRYVEERGGAEYTAEGEPSYMTGTVQDITARKEAEDHVRELNENLEARVTQRTSELALANDDLHEAMKDLKEAQGQLVESEKMASLGGLVAGVAHEINTPVGVGVTAASHLSEATRNFQADYANGNMKRRDLEKFVETAAHSTEIISGNLHRASELIRSFKQVAVDQSSDDRRTFKAREYLDEIVNSLKPRLKKTKHQIIINCDDSLVIDSFPGAWSQILTNLIMNSVIHAFDEDDSGVISVDMATDKKGVMLCYSDDGKGMPEDLVARVFEPFFTTKRGAGGSGLGMHILFNLVTAKLGGVVECTSEVGKGTTFTIATPLPKGQKDDRNAA